MSERKRVTTQNEIVSYLSFACHSCMALGAIISEPYPAPLSCPYLPRIRSRSNNRLHRLRCIKVSVISMSSPFTWWKFYRHFKSFGIRFCAKLHPGQILRSPTLSRALPFFCSNRGSFIFWNSDTVVGYDAGASPLEMVNGMKLFVFFALGVSGDCGSAVLLFSLSHHAISLLSFPCPHDQSVLPVSRLQTLWNNDYRAKRNLGPLWPEAQVQKEERWLISAHF